jgi:hypothetical protein
MTKQHHCHLQQQEIGHPMALTNAAATISVLLLLL